MNAPAVLLRLDFSQLQKKIGGLAAGRGPSAIERSLYAHAFSVEEEAAIVGRLYGLMAQP